MNRIGAVLCSIFLLLAGCKNTDNRLKIGVIHGPETELMQVAQTILKEQGIESKLVTFSDYRLPNMALKDGDIDVNVFQHKPYLDYALQKDPGPLVIVGKTFIYPMGLYSNQLSNIQDISTHSTVAIPNDPSNEARALKLLAHQGLITLKSSNIPTTKDILSNPKSLIIKPIEAANLPRMLDDVTLAAINLNYALASDLIPTDALALESKHSDYANIVVTRIDLKQDPRIKALVQALHDPRVLKRAGELFSHHAIAAWS